MKRFLSIPFKVIILTVLYFILFTAGGALLGPKIPNDSPTAAVMPAMLLVAFVDALVLMTVILRSNWSGWKLILATAVSYYGVQTFMAQIESAYFGPALGIDPTWLPGLFMSSLPIIFIFIPLAVLILGKGKGAETDTTATSRLSMPAAQWAWKLAIIAVMYVILYFSFGYLVAWQNPNLVAMYGNGANTQVFDNTKLVPLQLGRGILWALFALPVIRMSKGSSLQIALLVGLLLALPMNISHAIPNPIMPDPTVRLSHFIETTTSNFIFGTLLTLLLTWRPSHTARAIEQGQKANV